MRKSADIYGEYLKDKMINDRELASLQKVGLNMLVDLSKMCEEANIKYSIAFGTLLGAVRHKGFIPWDDDIDVFIFRKDLDKLKKIINEHYPNYYIMDSTIDKAYSLPFPKLMLKDTTLVEVAYESKKSWGVYIDLFLLDEAPTRFRKFRQKFYLLFSRLASLECDYKYPSTTLIMRGKDNKELKSYYNKRRFMGFFASILPISVWCKLRNQTLKGKKSDSEYVVSGDIFRYIKKEYFDNLALYDFEDKKLYGTKDYDEFLSNIYHDYMQLPPEDKRERHIIVNLDLSKVIGE